MVGNIKLWLEILNYGWKYQIMVGNIKYGWKYQIWLEILNYGWKYQNGWKY